MPHKIIFGLLSFLLLACEGRQGAREQTQKNAQKQPYQIQYAQNFEVQHFDTHKELSVKIASQTFKYALIKRGNAAPKGFEPSQIIETPVRTCILASHTHIACLQALGLEDRLVGLTEASYLPDSTILQKIAQKKVHEIGKNGEWQQELIFALKPDLVMLGNASEDSKLTLPAHTRKVVNADWQESNPLGRLEWLYFVSLFFEAEEKAIAHCKEKIKQYTYLTDLLKEQTLKRPKVIFDVPYKGVWYMPAGESYIATLLKDAQGEYAWQASKGKASLTLDFETAYAEAKRADIWLNVGACRKIADIIAAESRLQDIPALRAGKVYSYQRQAWENGANPYFMHSILHPDKVLIDLVKILHPDIPLAIFRKRVFFYYTQL